MTTLRRHRLFTVLLAVLGLLFMQLAVSVHACTVGASLGTNTAVTMSMDGMPCAQDMAPTLADAPPGMCQAHCQADQQSAHTTAMPDVPLVLAMALPFAQWVAPPAPPGVALQAPLLQRTTAPPLALQHCCLRS